MRILSGPKLDFKDVLILPKRSTLTSRKDVDLQRSFFFRNSRQQWTGIPIVAANMDGVGTWSMAKALSSWGMITAINKSYTAEDWIQNSPKLDPGTFTATTGVVEADLDKLDSILAKVGASFICVDAANGYTENFVRTVQRVRGKWPDKTLIAGNVATPEMVEELVLNGADIVKIGIGPGSVCTTRIQTGVGYPQLSAIIECADAAHGLRGHIMADGGCTCPGDLAKAFGAGADFVMLGGMFAGHDEGGGARKTTYENPKGEQFINGVDSKGVERYEFCATRREWVEFYGMSSEAAMEKHYGGVAEYRSSEGKRVLVPYRGPVRDTVLDLLGGLRSACTYVGAEKLKELSKRTTFVRVTQQSNDFFN